MIVQGLVCRDHAVRTNEDDGIEPPFVRGGEVQVAGSRRQDEGDGQYLDGVTGQCPTTQRQQQVVELPVA